LAAPNVRATRDAREAAALQVNYNEARARFEEDSDQKILDEYEEIVAATSIAVINRTPSALFQALHSEDDMSGNFYSLVNARLRRPGTDRFNELRPIVDQAIFPGYYTTIQFAVLTLDGAGLPNYGSCTLALSTKHIQERASVFDGNTLTWVLNEGFAVSTLVELPPGRRAGWADRGKLAVARVSDPPPLDSGHANRLLRRGATSADDDFIEVHIWGELTAFALSEVTLPVPADNVDEVRMSAIDEILSTRGIAVTRSESNP
jgi:hypothetical protein